MKKSSCFILVIFVLLCSSCRQAKGIVGSSKIVTKEVKVASSFKGLNLLGSPDVIYKQTEGKPRIEISGSDNLVNLLDIKVENDILLVKFKNKVTIFNGGKLKVRILGPALEKISIQGSGDILLANGIKTDQNLAVSINGSGDIKGESLSCDALILSVTGSGDMDFSDVNADHTDVKITGSGDITLNGKSEVSNFLITGSGDIDAADFMTRKVSARVSGSGDISCYATESLNGGVSGSGDVGYKGNPTISFSKKGLHKL